MIKQKGYFLVLGVILIMVIGLLGSVIAHMFSNRAMMSAAQLSGLDAFYIAESGLEIGTRLLTMPNISGTPTRIACGSLSGNAAVTNAALDVGRFTLSTISSPVFSNDTLSGAITATATTIPVVSTSGFASSGRIMVDKEAMTYESISGNSFIGVTRGVGMTTASTHTSGAPVSQYQCSLEVDSGIPTLTSPKFQRSIQWSVQLQDAWVAGTNSSTNFLFDHWNRPTEMAWTVTTLAGSSNATVLNGISMINSSDGFAVGNAVGTNFITLRYNGSAWTLTTVAGACSGQNLLSVSAVSSQEAWAVSIRERPNCSSGTTWRYGILKWNGSIWTELSPSTTPAIPADASTNQTLRSVHVIDTTGDGLGNIGFAVGDAGDIVRYNGTSWVDIASPTTNALFGVYVVSASEAWAVGASGTIIKFNGTSWAIVSSPTTTQLNEVRMYDSTGDGTADFGIAVGNTGRILMYNGSTWTSVSSSGNNLFGIGIFNPEDAYAVGVSGTILRWNGTAWSTVTSGTTISLNSMSVVQARNPSSNWRQVFN